MRTNRKRAVSKTVSKTRTTMTISRSKLQLARRILGSKTDAETVDRALELVLSNSEIEQMIDQVFGQIQDFRIT